MPWQTGRTLQRDRVARIACRTITLLLVVLALTTLTACGAEGPAAAPSPTGPAPKVTVPRELPRTIALAGRFSDPVLAVLDEQIAAFEAQNPDALVEIIRAPGEAERQEWVRRKLDSQDTGLDLFVLDATWPGELAAGGRLARLDQPLTDQAVPLNAFVPGVVAASSADGHLVALPWTAEAGLLYYRQDLLDRYGYDPPTTWADLQRIALEIKEKEGLPFGYVWQGAANEDLTCNTLEFVWALGGDPLDASGSAAFDSPQALAALEQMHDLVASGASPPDIATYDRWKALDAFQNGDAVFMRNWYQAYRSLNSSESPVAGKVGVAPLPAACLGGQSLGLAAHSLQPDKAARLIAFLVAPDRQAQLALAGEGLPVLETTYQDERVLSAVPILKQVRAALSVARPRPPLAAYSQASEVVYTEVNQMLAGTQGAATTAAKIQQRLAALAQ